MDVSQNPEERPAVEGGKASRRKPAVASQEVPQAPPAKVKTTVDLSWEASERLGLHALALRKTRSELMEQLINDNLRRFCLTDRGGAKADREAVA